MPASGLPLALSRHGDPASRGKAKAKGNKEGMRIYLWI